MSARPPDPTSNDESQAASRNRLLAALDEMERAAVDNASRSHAIAERAAVLRRGMLEGRPLVELVTAEASPRIVELLSTNMATLETAGAELRVAQAAALRQEGLTIERIAELFGVTRQRISALLRQRPV